MASLESHLLAQLECPICYETMSPPIHQCIGGHNICSSCRTQVQNTCPTCRQQIGNTRNYALENIAESMPRTCRNKPEGCSFSVTGKELAIHEDTCEFGNHLCPLAKETKCQFQGLWSQMIGHAEENHGDKMLRAQQFKIPHFEQFQENCYLFAREKDLFKITERLVRRNKNCLEILAQYIGPIEKVSTFYYKVEIFDENSNGNTNIARAAVKPYIVSDNKNYMLKKLQHHNQQQQRIPPGTAYFFNQIKQNIARPYVSHTNLYHNTEMLNSSFRGPRKQRFEHLTAGSFREIDPYLVFATPNNNNNSGDNNDGNMARESSKHEYVMSFAYSFIRNFCKDGILSYDLRVQKKL